jgi:hypothetical protein
MYRYEDHVHEGCDGAGVMKDLHALSNMGGPVRDGIDLGWESDGTQTVRRTSQCVRCQCECTGCACVCVWRCGECCIR